MVGRGPSASVLKEIFNNLYLKLDKGERPANQKEVKPAKTESAPIWDAISTGFNTAYDIGKSALDKLTGQEEVDRILNEVRNKIMGKIEGTITPQDFIELLFFMGEQAPRTQGQKKWRRTEQSRLCERIHMAIKYISEEMVADPECRIIYDAKIKEVEAELIDCRNAKRLDLHQKWGINTEICDANLRSAYRKLALLAYLDTPEHLDFIDQAKERGIFTYLLTVEEREKQLKDHKEREVSVCHDHHNKALPYCLQIDSLNTMYEDRDRDRTKESWSEFKQRAIQNGLTLKYNLALQSHDKVREELALREKIATEQQAVAKLLAADREKLEQEKLALEAKEKKAKADRLEKEENARKLAAAKALDKKGQEAQKISELTTGISQEEETLPPGIPPTSQPEKTGATQLKEQPAPEAEEKAAQEPEASAPKKRKKKKKKAKEDEVNANTVDDESPKLERKPSVHALFQPAPESLFAAAAPSRSPSPNSTK